MRNVVFGVLTIGAIAVAILAARLTNSSEAPPEPRIVIQTAPLGAAQAANIEGHLGAGTLRLASGSLAGAGRPLLNGELLRGDFTIADDTPAPAVTTETVAGTRIVRIAQEEGVSRSWPLEGRLADWTLYLNPTVPTALNLEIGSGDVNLALGGLTLTELTVVSGAGDTRLDFTGDWRRDLDATVRSGAGDVFLRLPSQVGVRVAIDQGAGEIDAPGFVEEIGFLVNDAAATAPVTITITIHQAAGDVRLELID
jgi:hypothetical protein